MKHIKKKFLNQFDASHIPERTGEIAPQDFDQVKDKMFKAKIEHVSQVLKAKTHNVIMFTDQNIGIPTFSYKRPENNTYIAIPEVDPVILFFHSAQQAEKSISTYRKKLLDTYQYVGATNQPIDEITIGEFYYYFSLVTSFTIMLFTSMEAFINRAIPEKYEHRVENKDKTEIYTKDQLIRKFSFMDKIKILSGITKKDFQYRYEKKFERIRQLKAFRDEVIHTKVIVDGLSMYSSFHTQALNLKHADILEVVKDYLNYYKPGLIEDCDCGAE